MYKARLEYDSCEQRLEWRYDWLDSVFVYRCAKYLTQKIVNDTALYLIEPCLLQGFFVGPRYEEQMLLGCAEYTIVCFHATKALMIPEVYYGSHQELKDWQEKRRFYNMIEFILSGSASFNGYGKEYIQIFKKIVTESNEVSPYYTQFRSIINSYSDMDLARITKMQEDEMVSVLLQGVANGEKKAKLTYSFMLLTGQFVEKNEEMGAKILSDLLSL